MTHPARAGSKNVRAWCSHRVRKKRGRAKVSPVDVHTFFKIVPNPDGVHRFNIFNYTKSQICDDQRSKDSFCPGGV